MRGPHMLHEPPERLRCLAGYDVRGRPVERIEKADSGGVVGCISMVGVEVAEGRKGGRLPGIGEGIEIIGWNTSSSLGVERGDLEIGRRRTRRARDVRSAVRSLEAGGTQKPGAADRF